MTGQFCARFVLLDKKICTAPRWRFQGRQRVQTHVKKNFKNKKKETRLKFFLTHTTNNKQKIHKLFK